MFNSTNIVHYAFGTGATYSHVPAAIKLCIRIVTLDPNVHISVMIHANHESSVQRLLAAAPQAQGRVKPWMVGEKTSHKEVAKAFLDMAYKSGSLYAQILADTSLPTPSVFLFDVTSHWYTDIKKAVEAGFPNIKSPKLVGYIPWSCSEFLHLSGTEANGSTRWIGPAATAKGVDLTVPKDNSPEGLTKRLADPEQLLLEGKLYEDIFIASDHLTKIPGVPPVHEFEFWSVKIDWSTSVIHHMMLDFNLAMQAVVGIIDSYISCYASDVLEPETYAALKTDRFITDGGKKPVFMAGHSQEPRVESGLGDAVQTFLDKQKPRSVILVSFGTLMDGGHGADVLFAHLAELKIPYVFAGGGQSSNLPQTTQVLVDAAELEGHAVAPEWLNQVGVLNHPSILCFISHCGVNSMVEAALAEVPILTWGKAWDQIPNSSQLAARGHGIELLQHREGCGVGRTIARTGEILTGKPETLRAEIRDAIERIKGDEGEKIRQNLKVAAAELKSRRTGVWDEDIKSFVKWTRGGEASA